MKQYIFAEQARVTGVSAQVAGERLELLQQRYAVLTPQHIVEDARPEDSELHPVFLWDDSEAAERYRETQARNLIKSVRVVQAENAQPQTSQRAYLNVVVGDNRGYMSTAQVMSDEQLRAQVLLKAKTDLNAWRTRYADLQEYADFFGMVDKVLAEVEPVELVS